MDIITSVEVSDFLSMGGHAVFVWPAYAVTATLMIGLLIHTRLGKKVDQQTLQSLQSSRMRKELGNPDGPQT